jgi:hypothetical protein
MNSAVDLCWPFMPVTSDDIRRFVREQYVAPARAAGKPDVVVRAGDVHSAMKLTSQMPHVVSAIGANKFEPYARVKRLRRDGPQNGANLFFTFRVLP